VRDQTFHKFYLIAQIAEKSHIYNHYKKKLIEFIEQKENMGMESNQNMSQEYSKQNKKNIKNQMKNYFFL
jgi:hypothetical protein